MSDSGFDYDAIIIGAGMSGLAAGIRLAMYDQRVCILERHTTIGGLNSFYRLDGRNYDVGLHALTNYVSKGDRRRPLGKVLKQLRFSWDEFQLRQQKGSQIAFGDVRLNFTNDIQRLTADVADHFPRHVDQLKQLIEELPEYEDLESIPDGASGREFVARYIRDPMLAEMLLAPLLYYGSAREQDIDLDQFVILFRSIYLEGFCRPREGVRLILRLLTRRYKQLGGELRLRCGVKALHTTGDSVEQVELDSGEVLRAKRIASSAGWAETRELLRDRQQHSNALDEARSDGNVLPPLDDRSAGVLSFVETLSVLDRPIAELGHDATIIFFNNGEHFDWRRPVDLVDPRSGVICCPENFEFEQPTEMPMVRVTCLANFDRWQELAREEYLTQKDHWYEQIITTIKPFVPDFERHVVAHDMFTPTTIKRFTGHLNGAVYGAPRKQRDGRTGLANLFICGTDQGFVGIIGTLVSGVSIANQHLLVD
ncbi:MAG: FAD-dependent oxidoreductase [Pirellulales bacterium]|nr:FAD-dependent oxidoreductase [Pirellulales bacterium]